MSEENKSSSPGFLRWFLLLFVALKLCNVIDWSWWWVLSPIWISLILVVVLIAIEVYNERNEI